MLKLTQELNQKRSRKSKNNNCFKYTINLKYSIIKVVPNNEEPSPFVNWRKSSKPRILIDGHAA